MPIFRFSLRNPAYAFVEYATKAETEDAIFKLRSKFLRDSDVEVDRTIVDPESSFAKFTRAPPQAFPDFERDYSGDDLLTPVKEGRRVYIGRVQEHNSMSPGQIRHRLIGLLQTYSVEALSKVHLTPREQFAFLDASTPEEAARIVAELNHESMLYGTLKVEHVGMENPAHGWHGFVDLPPGTPKGPIRFIG